MDRKYNKGGQLVKTETHTYQYDKEGNLKEKKDKSGAKWRYKWTASGMLESVHRPDGHTVNFKYDALGRRIEKRFLRNVTTYLWDGNVPLHEYRDTYTRQYDKDKDEYLEKHSDPVITWIFEEGTFVPTAKLQAAKQLSIITNYLGTPESMYDEAGQKTWSCQLNSFGKVRSFEGQWKVDCPFRYQGQYEDNETGLYYNRFRYYDPSIGSYLSQDPIGLEGNNPTLYGYVKDTNSWLDVFGLDSRKLDRALSGIKGDDMQANHVIPEQVFNDPTNTKFFRAIGVNRDDRSNGLLMPSTDAKSKQLGDAIIHRGSHPEYNKNVGARVAKIRNDFNNGLISKTQAKKSIRVLQKELRKDILNKKIKTNKTSSGCNKLA